MNGAITPQDDAAAKWAFAQRLLPMIRETFALVRDVDFDYERWDWFTDVLEHYLPRAVAQSDELTEAEQQEVLASLSQFIRISPRLVSRKRQRQILSLILSLTRRQRQLLAFFGVKDDGGA